MTAPQLVAARALRCAPQSRAPAATRIWTSRPPSPGSASLPLSRPVAHDDALFRPRQHAPRPSGAL
eukprot:13378238-Alexandrium_andersonii.AAC.1